MRKALLALPFVVVAAITAPFVLSSGVGVRGPAGPRGATGPGYVFTYGTYTATGTTQGTATAITTTVANVTSGDTLAVKLPASGSVSVGDVYEVLCSTSTSPGGWSGSAFLHYCSVFPSSGDTITPFSANAADTVPAGTMSQYRFKGSSTWLAEPSALKTSDGNASYGLSYIYGDLAMGGGGSSIARIQMSGNSGNQINMVGVGDNKISFPDNTASAFYLWTSSDGNKYLEFTSTNSGERVTVEQPLYVGPNSGGGANQLGIVEMVGVNGNQINFDTNSGENYIGMPDNTASALEFQVRANGTNMIVFTTTTNAKSVSVLGSQTNNNASTGYTGEYVSSAVTAASGVTGATTVTKNITSISLTSGDWNVTGICGLDTNITGTQFACGVTATSGTMPGASSKGDTWTETPTVSSSAADSTLVVPEVRVSISSTTVYYLVSKCTDSAGTCTMYGRLSARRPR